MTRMTISSLFTDNAFWTLRLDQFPSRSRLSERVLECGCVNQVWKHHSEFEAVCSDLVGEVDVLALTGPIYRRVAVRAVLLPRIPAHERGLGWNSLNLLDGINVFWQAGRVLTDRKMVRMPDA